MATPIPRPTRSRISSPFVPAPSNSSAETKNTMVEGSERPKTFLDHWVEPALPAPRPSFMDAGIERQGVLQNMAPLGTGPSQKILKTLSKPEMDPIFRTAKRGEASTSAVSTPTPSESVMTPEPPTIPQRERSASVTTVKEAESAPQTPQPAAVHRNSISRASVGPQNNGQGVFQLQPSPIAVPATTMQPTPPPPPGESTARPYHMGTPGPTLGADGLPLINLDITDRVVEEAVSAALDQQRYPTAYALCTLYDDHKSNTRMVRLIEAIYNQRADMAMRMEFATVMRHKKMEGRKDRTAEYYFNGDESFSIPEKRPVSQPIISMQAFVPPPATQYASPYTPLPRMATSLQGRSSSVNNLPSSSSKDLDEDEHINKKPRRSSYSTHFQSVNFDAATANSEINAELGTEMNRVGTNGPDTHSSPLDAPEMVAPETDSTETNGAAMNVAETNGVKMEGVEMNGVADEAADEAADDRANGTKTMSPEATPVPVPATEAVSKPKSVKSTPGKHKSTPGKERRGSTSSLSSVSSSIVAHEEENSSSNNNNSSGNMPMPNSLLPVGPPPPSIALMAHYGLSGLGMALGGLGAGRPRQFVSPYSSADNFIAAASSAETHARNQAQPIGYALPLPPLAPPPREKTGPKMGVFHVTVTTNKPAGTAAAGASNPNPKPKSAATTRPTKSTATATTKSKSSSPGVALSSSAKSPTTANIPPAASASSMAPAALLASSSNSSQTSFHHFPSSFKAKNLAKLKGDPYDPNDRAARMRRGAREKTNSLNESIGDSFERHPVQVPREEDTESGSDGGRSVAPKVTKRPPKVRLLNKKNRETRQTLNYDDSEDLSSPTLLSFQPDIAPGSLAASRAGTPNNLPRPTRKGRTGTGLRVKSSPMKKKGGTLAGIPRASGERNSPVGNGAFSNNQDDNDDYCSACGGNGDLVCCDGCTRSFHFKCADPPILEASLTDSDEWLCNQCISRRPGARDDPIPGIFGPLIIYLDEKNPSAFHLPKPIREYFDNVKTGEDGEYQEAGATKPKNNRGGGYEEAPDYYRLKDAKGKVILCHQCHGAASQPNRMIIPCSFCGLYWHMDCLPVPLAKEPAPGRQWRCPAHIDDLLQLVPAQLAPAHRFRKIKGLSAIKPAASRGIKNSGYIEIESEESEPEEEPGFYEQREYGHVYKLPERGIKLDFISKIRREGGGYRASRFADYGRPTSRPRPAWNHRNVNEQQAALNLASLAAQDPQNHDLKQLLSAVLTEASPDVIDMMAVDQAEAMADRLPKQTILTMKALFDRLYSQVVQGEASQKSAAKPASAFASPALPATPAETQPERAISQEVIMEERGPAVSESSPLVKSANSTPGAGDDTVIEDEAPSVHQNAAKGTATHNEAAVAMLASSCEKQNQKISPEPTRVLTPISAGSLIEPKNETQDDDDTEMMI